MKHQPWRFLERFGSSSLWCHFVDKGQVLPICKRIILLSIILLIAVSPTNAGTVETGGPSATDALPVILGTAGSFGVLAGQGVTNTGLTVVNGDLGTWPNPAITGFGGPPDGTVNGTIHAGDSIAQQAQSDLTTAYDDAAGRPFDATISADLGGQTLANGVYTGTSLAISAPLPLILDGGGDPDAVFIFQSASTLITGPGSSIELINEAQSCNVFWQVGSSATLDATTNFAGIILALTSISVENGAIIDGQLLARNGSVTLINDTITVPECLDPTPTPTITSTPIPPTETPTPTLVPPTFTPVPPTNTPIPPTETPTPTLVPPTFTPVPPTNTPVPPTNTSIPPTNTPIPPTNTQGPTSTPTCESYADIYVYEVVFDPPRANPGDIIHITVPVHNTGTVEIISTELTFYYDLTPFDPTDDPNMEPIGEPVVVGPIPIGSFVIGEKYWDTTGLEFTSYPVYICKDNTLPEECNPHCVQTDIIVPVDLYGFEAITGDGTVRLEWTTTTEINNLGFNLYQSTDIGTGFEKLNPTLIPGAGTSYEMKKYSWDIIGLSNGIPMFYYLEMVDYWGGLTCSETIIGVPHQSPLSIRLNTVSDRELYSVDDSMMIRGRLCSSGASGPVQIQIGLMIEWDYVGDILSPVNFDAPSIMDIDFDLLRHVWTGSEPAGEYRIVTILTDPRTGELIHINLNTFRFIAVH